MRAINHPPIRPQGLPRKTTTPKTDTVTSVVPLHEGKNPPSIYTTHIPAKPWISIAPRCSATPIHTKTRCRIESRRFVGGMGMLLSERSSINRSSKRSRRILDCTLPLAISLPASLGLVVEIRGNGSDLFRKNELLAVGGHFPFIYISETSMAHFY